MTNEEEKVSDECDGLGYTILGDTEFKCSCKYDADGEEYDRMKDAEID